jgi:hypothetical protein
VVTHLDEETDAIDIASGTSCKGFPTKFFETPDTFGDRPISCCQTQCYDTTRTKDGISFCHSAGEKKLPRANDKIEKATNRNAIQVCFKLAKYLQLNNPSDTSSFFV